MVFNSILNKNATTAKESEMPSFFIDLNLDQVINAITINKQDYNLKPFFYNHLTDLEEIMYRQEIMRDIEDNILLEKIKSFAEKMHSMREHLSRSEKLYYKYQKESWFLDAAEIYCDAVICLADDLSSLKLNSDGFLSFREYITAYSKSGGFTELLSEVKKLKNDLMEIKYCILINGNCVKVRKYDSEVDYSADVQETFNKFKQGAVKDYKVKYQEYLEMNHVEASIINFVAKLYPEIFTSLDNFYMNKSEFRDKTIVDFDREIQFYVSYIEYITVLKNAGLNFCYPEITGSCKEIYDYEGFDIALAYKLIDKGSQVICNDFYLKGSERIIVVSGPNQGGKTTFARAFGQLHHLANIGLPVPGKEARLFLYDMLFTHFEKEEDNRNLRGKLQDDLVRINEILNRATPNSIIIMNEIFTSTTLKDAVFLSKKIMEKIMQLDLLCVCVTFIVELATLSDKTISMVSTVVPENAAVRTFKIIRKAADGLAYAISIAEKYKLTYGCLKERIKG